MLNNSLSSLPQLPDTKLVSDSDGDISYKAAISHKEKQEYVQALPG